MIILPPEINDYPLQILKTEPLVSQGLNPLSKKIVKIALAVLGVLVTGVLLAYLHVKKKIALHYQNYRLRSAQNHDLSSIQEKSGEPIEPSSATLTYTPQPSTLIPVIVTNGKKRHKRNLHVTF